MGEAYVSRSTGRQVQARVMGPPCADGYYDKITLPIATVLHREFWAIGSPREYKHGKHTPVNIISDAQLERAMQHIHSFPSITSHYTQAKSPHMRYLESSLNRTKMYRLYTEWMDLEYPGEQVVRESYYIKVFNTKFRLGSTPPRTDTCSRCDQYNAQLISATEEDKARIQEEYEAHKDMA
ncbi:hypothetical protein E2C01_059583 [Portunus trituberculatus]|uniref:Uncharacterized protein n=1 Tax=Portunus trituberculatus TaxID=210409 RepID=A0A5B7H6M1_PORTR|nr:hypothetical protein [Portunus trituberculatus]